MSVGCSQTGSKARTTLNLEVVWYGLSSWSFRPSHILQAVVYSLKRVLLMHRFWQGPPALGLHPSETWTSTLSLWDSAPKGHSALITTPWKIQKTSKWQHRSKWSTIGLNNRKESSTLSSMISVSHWTSDNWNKGAMGLHSPKPRKNTSFSRLVTCSLKSSHRLNPWAITGHRQRSLKGNHQKSPKKLDIVS